MSTIDQFNEWIASPEGQKTINDYIELSSLATERDTRHGLKLSLAIAYVTGYRHGHGDGIGSARNIISDVLNPKA